MQHLAPVTASDLLAAGVYLEVHCNTTQLRPATVRAIKAAGGHYTECRGYCSSRRYITVPGTASGLASAIAAEYGQAQRPDGAAKSAEKTNVTIIVRLRGAFTHCAPANVEVQNVPRGTPESPTAAMAAVDGCAVAITLARNERHAWALGALTAGEHAADAEEKIVAEERAAQEKANAAAAVVAAIRGCGSPESAAAALADLLGTHALLTLARNCQ